MTDDTYDCPFPWCGFEGGEPDIRNHVQICGTPEDSRMYGETA